jgi:thiol-disulfide isomerase/thioredoxin
MKKVFILILSLVFLLSGCGLLVNPKGEPEVIEEAETVPTAVPETEPGTEPDKGEETPPAEGKGSSLPEGKMEELLQIATNFPFNNFSGETLDGGTLDTKDLKGDVLVVNLMATWCGWCTYELPFFAEATKHFKGEDVNFVGIDVWEDFSTDDYKDALKAELEKAGVDIPVLLDKDSSYANSLGIQGIPYTMIVDREGTVRFTNPGAFMSSDDFIAMVDMVLYHSDKF